MSVTICRCCMLEMPLPDGLEVLECPACGTVNSRPRAEGPSLEMLKRAVHQRTACDFANAERSYQHVLLDHPEEHEALWGLALCRYGVEYVEAGGKRLPTVHFLRRKPMSEDADVTRACALAPEAVADQYRRDAAYVDDVIARLTTGEPMLRSDIFICHKATVPGSGERTPDFERARSLYIALLKKGYEPFFAHDSLQDVAGANYEAAIYHALTTAKVMLVICSRADWLNSPWVRSEWSRFLERIDDGQHCCLIPLLYDGMKPSLLPEPFLRRRLEALRMDAVDAFESLRMVLARYGCGVPDQQKPQQPAPQPVVQQSTPVPPQPVAQQSTPVPAQPAQPVLQKPVVPGRLLLMRKKAFAGVLAVLEFYLDGKKVAVLKNGESAEIPVERDARLFVKTWDMRAPKPLVEIRAGYVTQAEVRIALNQGPQCEILSETPVETAEPPARAQETPMSGKLFMTRKQNLLIAPLFRMRICLDGAEVALLANGESAEVDVEKGGRLTGQWVSAGGYVQENVFELGYVRAGYRTTAVLRAEGAIVAGIACDIVSQTPVK